MIRALVGLLLFLLIYPFYAPAADGSRITQAVMVIGGLGLQIAGVQFEKQAQESYDAYLHTARPSEMQRLTEDYDRKHLQSLIASRVGVGLIGVAVLWAFKEQLTFTRKVEVAVQPHEMRVALHLLR